MYIVFVVSDDQRWDTLQYMPLAADCAADGVWECFFTAPSLKVTGAVGSPLNPLAVK